MKKSNKLLVGGFLAGLLLISAIHITLYAKYKAGNYTIYNSEDDRMPQSMQLFPNVLFVSVRNVPDAVVRFTDAAQVEKAEDDVQYIQTGDTLLITGKDSARYRNNGHQVAFNLPHNAKLSVYNSSLSFTGEKTQAENNPVIYLQKSNVLFSGRAKALHFGHLKVAASDSSTVEFHGNTQVANLEVQLSQSSFEYGNGDFGQLSIITDSLSRLSLQSKQLLKANIKTIAPR